MTRLAPQHTRFHPRAAHLFVGAELNSRVAQLFRGWEPEPHDGARPLRLNPSATRTRGTFARNVGCSRGAALLLEVVVALTVMVTSMGLLGAQLVGGLRMTEYAEELTRATQLADRVLALLELDPNTVDRFVEQREADGDFGEQYPGWFWRAYAEEVEETVVTVGGTEEEVTEEDRLSRVTIQILHQTDQERLDDIEDAWVVRQLHVLRAARGTVDLERDFGVPAEKAELLKANLPPEVLTEDGEIDFGKLVRFTGLEDLFTLLPMIMALTEQGGGLPGLDEGFPAGDLAELFGGGGASREELEGLITSVGGGIGGNDAIRELIQSQIGDQLSEEQLNSLLNSIGGGGAGGPIGGGRGGRRPERLGDEGAEGGRGARGIRDLDGERDEQNRRRGGR